MDNKFLADLQVTADELVELQRNERPFGLLSDRQKKILNAATQAGCSHFWADGRWVLIKPRNGCCWGSYTYRLHPDLTLPEPPQRPSDPREPFRWTIDGHRLWCCPMFTDDYRMYFRYPHNGSSSYWVSTASSFIGFCGVVSANEDGLPCKWRSSRNISEHLANHHWSLINLDFVCFKVEEE
jgi:hypothetical protein